MGPSRRLVATLAAALAVALGLPRPAAAQRAIGPGVEAQVMALFAPLLTETDIAPGVRFDRVQVDLDAITAVLVAADGAEARLVLRPTAPGQARAFAEAPATAPPPAPLAAGLALLRERVASNDRGDFPFLTATVASGPLIEARSDAAPWERRLALAAWLALLAVAIARGRRWWATTAGGPRRQDAAWAVGAWAIGFGARAELPWLPLHANGHAFEEAAVAVGATSAAAAERLWALYGPAWRMAQQPLVALAGGHFEAMVVVHAAVGGVATAATALAARTIAGPVAAGWAALALALLPLARQVAGSESDLVFAQALVALGCLWAARPRHGLDVVGVAAVVALLATGHVVGPPWAAAMAALAVALRQRARAAGPRAEACRLGPLRWALSTREALAWAAALGATGLGAGLLRLAVAGPFLAARTTELQQGSSGVPMTLTALLAEDGAFFAPTVLALAVVGVVGDLAGRRLHAAPLAAFAGTVAWWLGCGSAWLAAVIVSGCHTDALRYQAPAMVVVIVAAAHSGDVARWCAAMLPWRLWRAVAWPTAVALIAVVTFDIVRPHAAAGFTDSQARGWLALRAAWAQRAPEQARSLTLLQPRGAPSQRVVVEMPRGAASRLGPTFATLRLEDADARCVAGQALPEDAAVWLPPACDAAGADCGALRRYRAGRSPLAAGRVDVAADWRRDRTPAEFLTFERGWARWELWRAACPQRGPAAGKGAAGTGAGRDR